LLFSQIVHLMGQVVCGIYPSANAAYQKQRERFTVWLSTTSSTASNPRCANQERSQAPDVRSSKSFGSVGDDADNSHLDIVDHRLHGAG
jgi:hypothetical protein